MAYKITRSDKIIDTLELMGSDGETKAVVNVNIDVYRIAGEYRSKIVAITEAEQKIKEISQNGGDIKEALQALQDGIRNAYILVLGEKVTDELALFFEDDYQEMFVQTFPFLRDVVAPAITKYAKSQRKQIMQAHKKRF